MSRILINQGNHQTIVQKLQVAESTAERARGLLGRTSLPNDTGLLILPCRSIHMWFMRFPIDAAFLDAEMRVLKIARHLRPWQLAFGPRRTHCVLETASGVLAGINTGDRLAIKE